MRFALIVFASQLFAALALSAEARVGSDRFLYLLDNDPAGNFILSFSISSTNGTLSSGVRTSTGGYGINLLVISPQDSVHISGNVRSVLLFPSCSLETYSNHLFSICSPPTPEAIPSQCLPSILQTLYILVFLESPLSLSVKFLPRLPTRPR